ncbi:Uncharacterised protein [uncultured archaeon]|nr:Uncharacterised protein [uncultured archaeon]
MDLYCDTIFIMRISLFDLLCNPGTYLLQSLIRNAVANSAFELIYCNQLPSGCTIQLNIPDFHFKDADEFIEYL